MTHSTTTGPGHTRRTAVPVLVALALVGTTAATSSASAAPAGAAAAAATATATATATTANAIGAATAGSSTDLGFLTRITRTTKGTTLTFDRAVLLTGAAADAEQRRRGLDTSGDAFVVNDNRRLRTRTVAPGVSVVGSQLLTGSPAAKPVSLDRLRSSLASRPKGRTGPLFRLTLDRRSSVVRIAEVYLP